MLSLTEFLISAKDIFRSLSLLIRISRRVHDLMHSSLKWLLLNFTFPQIIIGFLGIVGNTVSIVWFSRKKVLKDFHQLMLAVAVYDLLYVSISIIIFSLPSLFPNLWTTSGYLHLVPKLLPLAQVGLSGSIYFTMAIAAERYCTICHPFWKVRCL